MNPLHVEIDMKRKVIELSRETFAPDVRKKFQGKPVSKMFPDGIVAGVPLKETLKSDFEHYHVRFVKGSKLSEGMEW